MRIALFLLMLLVGIVTRADAQAPRDWRQTVTKAASGAYVVGNPQARVTLVEWLSYTCPHCAHFVAESGPELKDRLVRTGRVRVEYRTMPRDGLDMAAGLLVRCTGPRRFLAAHELVFANQKALLDAMIAFQAMPDPFAGAPTTNDKLARVADRSGLKALLRGRFLTDAQMTACLSSQTEQDALTGIGRLAATQGVMGTPSFRINDKPADARDWASLKPMLAAAGAP